MAANRLSQGIVLSLSAEPLNLPAAPLRFLLRLRQLAGENRWYETHTSSLARIMECCPNTIRNWRNILIEAGYLHWVTDLRNRCIRFYLTPKVETPTMRALIEEQQRLDALPAPLPWQPPRPILIPAPPRPWWKSAAISNRCLGSAQQAASLKKSGQNLCWPQGQKEDLAQEWGPLPF